MATFASDIAGAKMLAMTWLEIFVTGSAAFAAVGAQAWLIIKYFWSELEKRDITVEETADRAEEVARQVAAAAKLDYERVNQDLQAFKLKVAEDYSPLPDALIASERRMTDAVDGLREDVSELRKDIRGMSDRINSMADKR